MSGHQVRLKPDTADAPVASGFSRTGYCPPFQREVE